MFFSDLHVQILARGILNPGEQLLGQTVTDYMPWWAFGLVRRQHLVLATDQRIVILDHRYDLLRVNQILHRVESLPWSSVAFAKVTGIFKKKLKVRGTNERGQPINISAKIPNSFLAYGKAMNNNMPGAKNVVAAFESKKGGAAPALGMAQGYAQAPALSYAPPPAQLQGGYAQHPAINAPGYNSAPPPAQPQAPQVAAPRSPFDPPPTY